MTTHRRTRLSTAILAVIAALLATGCTTTSGGSPPTFSGDPTTPSLLTPTSSPPPAAEPPFIARVAWVSDSRGRILRVYPTAAGRGAALSGSAEAWSEVLRLAADAGTRGMRAQFDCHWRFARIVEPEASSWNLEPWRPVVSDAELIRSRCNPGGAEESVPDSTDSPDTRASSTGSSAGRAVTPTP